METHDDSLVVHEVSKSQHRDDFKIKVLTVVVVASLLVLVFLTYTKFNDGVTVHDIKKVVDRQDCARNITNKQQVIKDDLSSASRTLSVLNAKGLEAVATKNEAALLALVPAYDKAITDLAAQKTIVDKLPTIQKLVNKKCTNL